MALPSFLREEGCKGIVVYTEEAPNGGTNLVLDLLPIRLKRFAAIVGSVLKNRDGLSTYYVLH